MIAFKATLSFFTGAGIYLSSCLIDPPKDKMGVVRVAIGSLAAGTTSLLLFLDKSAGSQNSESEIEYTTMVSSLVELCHFAEKDAKLLAKSNPTFAGILIAQAQTAERRNFSLQKSAPTNDNSPI